MFRGWVLFKPELRGSLPRCHCHELVLVGLEGNFKGFSMTIGRGSSIIKPRGVVNLAHKHTVSTKLSPV